MRHRTRQYNPITGEEKEESVQDIEGPSLNNVVSVQTLELFLSSTEIFL